MSRNFMQHIKAKAPSPKRVYQACALLLFLAVGSSMLATAPFAKYVTDASGSDSARVAKFSVSAASSGTSATSHDYTLNSTTTAATYDFTVTSDSEVATKYDVKVTVPKELVGVTPTLKVADSTTALSASQSSDKLTYTFSNVGTFAAGNNTETLHLTFTKGDTATEATYENIKVEAVVTQVD